MSLAARLRLATREKGAGVLVGVVVLVACGGEPAALPASTPLAKQAVVVIEPPRLRVGDIAVVEVAVVTPPGHRVHPVKPPSSVPGLWLLDAETLPAEIDGARQVQRTRIRVRARETGSHEWPAQPVEIEDPGGAREELVATARPFEIVSVLPEFPERAEPFSYRMPSERDASMSGLAAAAAGSAATLAMLGTLVLVRRARTRARLRRASAAQRAATQPWIEALAALETARAESDWRSAAGTGARALRRFIAHRFAAGSESLTTEEFAELAPPFGTGPRWPVAIACLRAFDAERFRGASEETAAAQVRAALEATRQFVEASIPPESRR